MIHLPLSLLYGMYLPTYIELQVFSDIFCICEQLVWVGTSWYEVGLKEFISLSFSNKITYTDAYVAKSTG